MKEFKDFREEMREKEMREKEMTDEAQRLTEEEEEREEREEGKEGTGSDAGARKTKAWIRAQKRQKREEEMREANNQTVIGSWLEIHGHLTHSQSDAAQPLPVRNR